MTKQEEQKCEACDKAFKFNKLSHTLCNDCCNEDELKAFANLPDEIKIIEVEEFVSGQTIDPYQQYLEQRL